MAHRISQASFQQEVIDKKGLVLVDFYAEWCGPCKMVAPIIEELAKEMPEVSFVEIDVDADGELAEQFNVSSIPTFIVFKDGKPSSQAIGAMGKEGFQDLIEKAKSA